MDGFIALKTFFWFTFIYIHSHVICRLTSFKNGSYYELLTSHWLGYAQVALRPEKMTLQGCIPSADKGIVVQACHRLGHRLR